MKILAYSTKTFFRNKSHLQVQALGFGHTFWEATIQPTILFFFFNLDVIYLFLERGKEREKERERNISVQLPLCTPTWGPGPQPRHVP